MTTTQVVETSVTNNSLSRDYLHPQDHTTQTTHTPGFKPLTKNYVYWTKKCLIKKHKIPLTLKRMHTDKHSNYILYWTRQAGSNKASLTLVQTVYTYYMYNCTYIQNGLKRTSALIAMLLWYLSCHQYQPGFCLQHQCNLTEQTMKNKLASSLKILPRSCLTRILPRSWKILDKSCEVLLRSC